MIKKKKSWVEKLYDTKDFPRVEVITEKMSKRWGTGTVVIPSPLEVDELMKSVPEGKLMTINQIREALAKKHKATICCPITTGIFARTAAGAAEEPETTRHQKYYPVLANLAGWWRDQSEIPGRSGRTKRAPRTRRTHNHSKREELSRR